MGWKVRETIMPPSEKPRSGLAARGAARPGGRTERVRQAVAAAVLECIENGRVDFSVQYVAQRAGVARSTLYARWPSREALITEALTAHSREFTFEPGRNWQETLRNMAFAFRDFSLRPAEIAINSLSAYLGGDFIAEETRRIWGDVTALLSAHLNEAQSKGEIRSDINPVNVVAAIMTCISGLVVMGKRTPSDEFIAEIVGIHIRGCMTPEAAAAKENGS